MSEHLTCIITAVSATLFELWIVWHQSLSDLGWAIADGGLGYSDVDRLAPVTE